jgi:Ras-related protein Rab-7A
LGVAFYRGADACILVYDITAEKSFEQLNSWRDEFLTQANPVDPENFSFVVIGNKVDKETERRVPKSKATQWCKSKGPKPIPYFETSAKESIKVEVAFLEAAQMALHRQTPETEPQFVPETIRLGGPANRAGGPGGSGSSGPAPRSAGGARSGGCC